MHPGIIRVCHTIIKDNHILPQNGVIINAFNGLYSYRINNFIGISMDKNYLSAFEFHN